MKHAFQQACILYLMISLFSCIGDNSSIAVLGDISVDLEEIEMDLELEYDGRRDRTIARATFHLEYLRRYPRFG